MITIRVRDILPEAILVSRESARLLQSQMQSFAAAGRDEVVVVDFQGVAGVAPSFVDEILTIFESMVRLNDRHSRNLVITHPPTRLSSKFEAVARGHGMSIRPREDGSWELASAA